MSLPEILAKYQAAFLLMLNTGVVWICWSLRQLAKTEVNKVVDTATAALAAQHTKLSEKVEGHHDTLGKHGSQIEEIRADIRDLPTKADIERLNGEIRTVGRDVAAASAGIERIEGYFLKLGVEANAR